MRNMDDKRDRITNKSQQLSSNKICKIIFVPLNKAICPSYHSTDHHQQQQRHWHYVHSCQPDAVSMLHDDVISPQLSTAWTQHCITLQWLFHRVLSCSNHVLHCLLPDKRNHVYQLRSRPHDCTLTANDDTRNFIYRLLHCDIYWFVTILSFLSHCLRCVMSSFH